MNDVQTQEEQTIIGPNREAVPVSAVRLGIEKFLRPRKHYRLIWLRGKLAWLAEEDETEFRRKGEAVAAGQELARRLGLKRLQFSELTR